MSWIDKIQTDFIITCGDGKSYAPQWLNASKSKEYNVAEFNFKDVTGSLVYRSTPRGRRYIIEIVFGGDEHLDKAAEFETSADNPKPWVIQHPYYGRITVQPLGLTFDNSEYNVTRITGGIVETIEQAPDVPIVSAVDKISDDKAAIDTQFAASYATAVPEPKAKDIQSMIRDAAGSYNAVLGNVTDTLDAETLTNFYNTASSAASSASTSSTGAITSLQNLMSLPAMFALSAVQRVGSLASILDYLIGTLTGTTSLSGKKAFEAMGGSVVSAMLTAATTNTTGSYPNRVTVATMIDTLLAGYNQYISALEGMQSVNAGAPGAYVAAAGPLTALSQLVGYTISVLFDIAAGSRQERTLIVPEDTNVILLADQLYGLKSDDSTIDELIDANSIGLNEILLIKKGRQIVYYV
jgi:hypothetical protein